MSAEKKLTAEELQRVISTVKDRYRGFVDQLASPGQYGAILSSFLPKIKGGDKFEANLVVELVIEAVRDPSVSCEVKYRCLHLLKDCMQSNHGNIGMAVADRHLGTILAVLKNAQSSSGATLFKPNPSADDILFSQRSFNLLAICIQAWSDMFPQITEYMDAFVEIMTSGFDLSSTAEYGVNLGAGNTPAPPGPNTTQPSRPISTPPTPAANSSRSEGPGGLGDQQQLDSLKELRTLMIDMITENKEVPEYAPELVKDYEQTYNQVVKAIGGSHAIQSANPRLKYELYYAEEFFKAFDAFSCLSLPFDKLQLALKNGIDKITRDRIDGRVPPTSNSGNKGDTNHSTGAPNFGPISTPPPPLPVQRSDMPSVHSNNPFANALRGGPNDRDNSMLDHSGIGNVKYDQYEGNLPPRGPGYSQASAGMNTQQQANNPEIQSKINSLESQLLQQKQIVNDLKKINDEDKRIIDQLRQEKYSLQNELDQEKRRSRGAGTAGSTDQTQEINRLQKTISALESEISNLNRENNKMFDALKSNNRTQSGSEDSQTMRQKISQLTTENGYLKDQLASAGRGGTIASNSSLDPELLLLKQKINKLESENAALRDQTINSSNQELASLQAEMRKLKSDAQLEIKTLKSKLLVAEEMVNTLMDQYKEKLQHGYSLEAQKPAASFDTTKFLQELYSTNNSYETGPYSGGATDYSSRLGGLVNPPYLSSALVTSLREHEQSVLRGYASGQHRSRSPLSEQNHYASNPSSYNYTSGLSQAGGQVTHFKLGKSPVAVPAGSGLGSTRLSPVPRPSYEPAAGTIDMRASHLSTVSIPLNGLNPELSPRIVYGQPAAGGRRSVSRGLASGSMQGFSDQYIQRTSGYYRPGREEGRPHTRVVRAGESVPSPDRSSYTPIYTGETRHSRSPGPSRASTSFLAEFSRKIRDLH